MLITPPRPFQRKAQEATSSHCKSSPRLHGHYDLTVKPKIATQIKTKLGGCIQKPKCLL